MVAIPSNEVAEGIFKAICYICLIAAVCFLPSAVIVSLFEQRRLAKQRQTGLDNETTFKNPETGALLSRNPAKQFVE